MEHGDDGDLFGIAKSVRQTVVNRFHGSGIIRNSIVSLD